MKTLVVISHPRQDSLTFSAANEVIKGLKEQNHEVEILDLYRHDFNPLVFEEDEPDYSNAEKVYSKKVEDEMERIRNVDSIVFIFPIWWHSIPAMLKGYIDRVFNYGFAYGPNKLPVDKIRWLGFAGDTRESFKKRGYHLTIEHHLNVGISGFVGVDDSEVEILYNTIGKGIDQENTEAHYEDFLKKAYLLGKNM
ncbi:NAD(P)H oxidoreductase [Desnuesiella massiliensis]|uniref:NAD(P)H oxidoreductase n=1 Tax=Desnuesiella massiliensis TaxID=1650662 RepID=UPI0006E2B320|nr:NAD(P)H oxidoreductase [Desnuesiella massiliensis]